MRKIKRDNTPPQGEIRPITLEERGALQEMTIEEIAELHEELMDGKPCICVSCSFRAAQLAFSKLYREIPNVENLTPKNYISTFFRKSTNSMFQVQVRPEIFPEGFFAQRRIVEF